MCDLIVPREVAKPEDEVLRGSQTRPIFVAQLIREKTKWTESWTGIVIVKEVKRTNPYPHRRATDIR